MNRFSKSRSSFVSFKSLMQYHTFRSLAVPTGASLRCLQIKRNFRVTLVDRRVYLFVRVVFILNELVAISFYSISLLNKLAYQRNLFKRNVKIVVDPELLSNLKLRGGQKIKNKGSMYFQCILLLKNSEASELFGFIFLYTWYFISTLFFFLFIYYQLRPAVSPPLI